VEISDYLRIIWRRLWILLLVPLVAGGAGMLVLAYRDGADALVLELAREKARLLIQAAQDLPRATS
jgi:hypothetical protein